MLKEIGLLLLSGEGVILWANSAATELLGYSRNELYELALPFIVSATGSAATPSGPVASAFREILEGNSAEAEGLARFLSKDQKRVAVQWRLWRLPNSGRRIHVLLSLSETISVSTGGPITYAYQHDFEDAEEGIFRSTIDGKLMEVNTALAKLLGYTPEALNGPMRSILAKLYVDPERGDELIGVLQEQGFVSGFESEVWRADKSLMWTAIFARRVHGNDGRPLYFEGRVVDITDRKRTEIALKKSEERFRRLVETTHVIPFEFDLATQQFTYVGPQAQLLLGHPIRSGFTLEAWTLMLHPEDVHEGTRFFRDVPPPSDRDAQTEFRVCATDGSVIWIKQIVHSGDADDNIQRIRGFLFDITEAKEIEEDRENSQFKLRQLAAQSQNVREEERMIIAREIHDELGQSLTLSKIDLAWLAGRLARTVAEDIRKPLETKISEMERMLDSTLETVRRILSALRPPLLDDLGLKAAIEFHMEDFTKRVGMRSELNIASLEHLPVGHSTAIFRILQEILTNVARHAKASRIRVHLYEAKSHLVLTVEDNGRGISERDVRESKHFGILGMQERAWSIGGELEIYRQSQGGTRVTLKLPIGTRMMGSV